MAKPKQFTIEDLKSKLKREISDLFTEHGTHTNQALINDLVVMVQQAQQEAVERERKEFIERLRNAMDEYNSLPENAVQFAFYLKVQDIGRFFEALQQEQE